MPKRKLRIEPNPFRKKRVANGTNRYLNKRESLAVRGTYDRNGNQVCLRWRDRI